jgi:hypothetical protein
VRHCVPSGFKRTLSVRSSLLTIALYSPFITIQYTFHGVITGFNCIICVLFVNLCVTIYFQKTFPSISLPFSSLHRGRTLLPDASCLPSPPPHITQFQNCRSTAHYPVSLAHVPTMPIRFFPPPTFFTGSIPGGVTGFFSDIFPSDRSLALGST